MQLSKRGAIDPFYVMEVMKAAAEREAAGGDVIHMEVGQPSTPAPRKAIEAAVPSASRWATRWRSASRSCAARSPGIIATITA